MGQFEAVGDITLTGTHIATAQAGAQTVAVEQRTEVVDGRERGGTPGDVLQFIALVERVLGQLRIQPRKGADQAEVVGDLTGHIQLDAP